MASKLTDSKQMTYPNSPGWWWLDCGHNEREAVEVSKESINGVRTLVTRVENLSTGRMEMVDVRTFNWFGGVNPVPLPMPMREA